MRAFHPRREHSALYGVSADSIAIWCRVHITTARRWKRGEDPPFAAIRWTELKSTGNLGLVDPLWDGWALREGMLVSPEQVSVSTGEIRSLPFLRTLIAHYQAEQRLTRQSDWVSGRWEPAKQLEAG